MGKKERVQRPKPERTRPIRNWSTLFAVPPAAEAAGADRREATLDDVVSRSVELGYRVVDEYVRQGQKAAQRFNERSYGADVMARDAQELMARMAQYASDFMTLWFEFVGLTAAGGGMRMPGALPGGERPAPAAPATPVGRAPGAKPGTAEPTRVRIEVASVQPAEVSLDLRPDAVGLPLAVHALRAAEAEKPRLTDVGLHDGVNGGPPRLRIRIPPDHPAGVYNGLIVDERTSRPVGSVSVRIGSEP